MLFSAFVAATPQICLVTPWKSPDLQVGNHWSNYCLLFFFSICLPPFSMPLMRLSMELPEGEVSSPDHWLVPVLSQLWDGRFLSYHQQEPTVQAWERDKNLYHTAMHRPNSPHQGEVDWRRQTDVEHRLNIHNVLSQHICHRVKPKRLVITLINKDLFHLLSVHVWARTENNICVFVLCSPLKTKEQRLKTSNLCCKEWKIRCSGPE